MDTTSIVVTIIVVIVIFGAALFVLKHRQDDIPTSTNTHTNLAALAGGDSELNVLLARGNKIAAIKRVRELTGVGLKEAKDYVESRGAQQTPS